MTTAGITTLRADYANPAHAAALVLLLDAYAGDPAGGGQGLSAFAKANLVASLAARPQASMSSVQPVGTAKQKRSARRRPRLAASAVDSVVFGPGEKLIAVQKISSAVNSVALMEKGRGLSVREVQCNLAANTPPVQLASAVGHLYW